MQIAGTTDETGPGSIRGTRVVHFNRRTRVLVRRGELSGDSSPVSTE